MGQYYKPVNVDKMEFLYSHDFDNGLKLMEHSYIGNNFMNAVEHLLSPGGSWHKCQLVWAGDYMDEGIFLPPNTQKKINHNGEEVLPTLYEYVYEKGTNALPCSKEISEASNKMEYDKYQKKAAKLVKDWLKTLPERGRYLVNHTEQVCLDLNRETNNGKKCNNGKNISIIHPLSLLTCSGNGRGGGDYHGNNRMVEAWAGDIISLEHEPMYELIAPICFVEETA